MFDRWRFTRTVTIIRPEDGSIVGAMHDELYEDDPWKQLENDITRNQVDHIRFLVEKTAKRMRLHLNVYEYILFHDQCTPSRKGSPSIEDSRLIAAFNPDDHLLSYLSMCVRKNPMLAVLLASDKPLEAPSSLLENSVPLLRGPAVEIQRVFPMNLGKPAVSQNQKSIRDALRFPWS